MVAGILHMDENIQNNLMKMSNVHISCEYTSGKSKFLENKRVSFIRTTGITNNVNPPKEIISINNKRIFPPIIPTPNANNDFEHRSLRMFTLFSSSLHLAEFTKFE
ncbi:uncharacterized protein LOC126764536 isoform X3 [Bactrocera neohumeralis]|uniref:uncharacterized protein LOC126764536 isoform X3 n=1 Tax=Bactrocera neohumeralis TaxID=98809 RepID=UPI0021653A6F|nr:uncharacterized protein LOC126764536 isoform X3 [Bactrocera neohumeralis]